MTNLQETRKNEILEKKPQVHLIIIREQPLIKRCPISIPTPPWCILFDALQLSTKEYCSTPSLTVLWQPVHLGTPFAQVHQFP